ncbi:MAG: hypothetical protein RJA35_1408 [Actinomycetota bacterium]|jgi:putative endonuclease
MTKATKLIGKYGEDRACEYLLTQGYQILDRNFQTTDGELDIVGMIGGSLVFIEVKTRTSYSAGSPLEAITHQKLSRQRKLAAIWCSKRHVSNVQVRFDAIGVLVIRGRVTIEHLKQVI